MKTLPLVTHSTFPLLLASFAFLGVSCSGSGSGNESIRIELSSDEECYGIEMDVDLAGLSAADRGTPESCLRSASLPSPDCETEVRIVGDRYSLSVSDCYVASDAPLFDCSVTAALADRFRSLDVRCGCGCADDCPSAVAAEICDDKGECLETALQAVLPVSAKASPPPGVERSRGVQSTTTSSTTPHCGTCCDAQDIDTGVKLTSDVELRELRFDLAMPISEPDCPQINDCDLTGAFDGPSELVFGEDTIHVCLAGKAAVNGPLQILSCSINSDGSDEYQISNVTGLDERLRVVTPDPVLVNDPGAD